MLTNSDLKQILDALARYGKKDSQLDTVPIDLEHPEGTFTTNDYLSIVQDGKNKTIKIKNLEKVFLLTFLTDEDFREALKGRIPGEMLENASVTTEKLADGSITTIKLGDRSVTNTKLSDNAVTSSKLADNSVTTSKIVDESVTTSKLNTNAVTTDKLANSSVTTDKIANGAVTSSKIADNSLSGANFGNNTIEGTKIKDNSIPGSKLADGAIESIDIKDGTLSGSKLADNSVTGAKLQDSVITGMKIADNSIPGSKIADSTIQNLNIANNSISGSKLVDNAITTDKIANNAINSAKLANDAITENKIVDNSVTTNKITDRAVTNSKLANNSVTSDKIADNSVTSSMITDYAVTENKLDNGSITASKIAPNAVTTTKLGDNAITSDKIVDGSVTEQKLADNSVTTDKIDTDAVTNVKIADNAVTESKIATNAVTTTKIVDSSVTTVKIADNTVTTIKLADGAVIEDKLADGAVTTAKLADGLISEIQNITDATPTEGSVKPVQSGGVKTAIDNVAFSTNEKVKDVGIDDEPTAESENLVKSGGIVKKLYGYVDMTIEGSPLSLPSTPSTGGFDNATSTTAVGDSSCAWNYGGYARHVYIDLINVKIEGYKHLKVVANSTQNTYLTFVKKAGIPSTNSNKSFDSLVSDGYLSSVHSDYDKVLIMCPKNETTNIEIPNDAIGVYVQYKRRSDSSSMSTSARKPESITPKGLFINGDITTIKKTLANLPDETHLVNPKEESLAFANDVMQLKVKLEEVTANEIKVTPIKDWHPEGSSSGYYNNGSWANNNNFKSTRIDVSGYKSIRFLGYNHHFNSFTPQYVFFDDNNTIIGGYHEYYDSTIEDGKDIELNLSVPDGAKYFVCLYKAYYASSGITYLTESKFYAYLQKGDKVVDLIDKSKVQVIDNLNTDDATKALSAKQGKVLSDTIFGEVTPYSKEVNFDVVPTKTGQLLASYIHGSSDSTNGKIWVVSVEAGETLQIQAREDIGVYLCILTSNPTIPPDGIPAEDTPVATNCEGYVTSGAGNYRMVIAAGSSATIKILEDSDAKYVYIQKLFHSSTTPLTPQSFVIQKRKREGGLLEKSKVDAGFYLTVEHGDIDESGKIISDDNKVVTNFINNGNGFYIELENGYYVERAVLYDKSGNLATYNYYVHSTSGHALTDNNCWGNNEQLSQFLVRLVLNSESNTNVPLNNIVKRFVYLNDNRLTKVFPQNLDYAKFMYKLHQLTNIIWVPAEKAQHNYGGDGINNALWFLKDTIVTGVPYSTETEYSKFIGIDVALRTFLSAAKNKRSVIYTECVAQNHARSAYGFSYHGEANYTGNFYGSVCTGLTSYLLGYNVNEYVGNMNIKLGNDNKIAHGKETLYWGDNVVTIDDLVQQLQPMDIILNSAHISVISDVYKDEYGVVQYIVWTEQTGPTARMIPYSKDMLAKRFAHTEFSIYRLPSETWTNAFTKGVEDTKGIIQNSFFDFEPEDVDIDPDISTFEGEYAVFVNNGDNDNTDSYNNYKAFLNIHRNSVFTTLQIFGEDEDVSMATPTEVNIGTNSGTFIYNSSIYADDSIDKDDWIIVDLMQLSPKLSAGKYKARVVGSNIESGFTHFQIVSISMTPTWNDNYVTRLDFEIDGGVAVAVSQQNNIRPIKIKDINDSEQGQGYVTFSGDGWEGSDYYIKLVVHADYGTAVKRITKSSYSA